MINNIHIKFFGRLVDLTQTESCTLEDVTDLNDVITKIQEQYPAIKNSTYSVALDKVITTQNVRLREGQTVAFMPPYSGG